MLKVICKFKNVPIGWQYKLQFEDSIWKTKNKEEDHPNPDEKVISKPE